MTPVSIYIDDPVIDSFEVDEKLIRSTDYGLYFSQDSREIFIPWTHIRHVISFVPGTLDKISDRSKENV